MLAEARMSKLRDEMDKIGFDLISKDNPRVIESIKARLSTGGTVKEIEKALRQKWGVKSTTVNLTVCAAYYLESNPDLFKQAAQDR
jgi:hypothetical protein